MLIELVEAIVNLLGVGIIVVVYSLGGIVTDWIAEKVNEFSDRHHLKYDNKVVDWICKGFVIVVALIVCIPDMPPIADVLGAVMPGGDFFDIAEKFAAQEDKWIFNIAFNIILEQFALTIMNFIPYLLLDMVISTLQKFLCSREEQKCFWKDAATYIINVIMLFAVNALVIRSGMLFPWLMMEFLGTYRFSAGLGYMIVMILPMSILLSITLRDMVTSDILVSILGVNITVAVMQVAVSDENRWIMFAVAVGCGMVSKWIKSLIPCKEKNYKTDAIGALPTLAGAVLISWFVFSR